MKELNEIAMKSVLHLKDAYFKISKKRRWLGDTSVQWSCEEA